MKSVILIPAIVILSLTFAVRAIDFRGDPTFVSPFASFSDIVHDMIVTPDGDLLVAGELDLPGNATAPFVRRINPDGSFDASFDASALNGGVGQSGRVRRIYPLAGGQYLIAGDFYVGTTSTNFARLNSDGSVDGTLLLSGTSYVCGTQPDGKLIACNDSHVVNGQTYKVAHRLNADGTFDPTFRITWADTGFTEDVKVLPDGKILHVGSFNLANQGTPLKHLNKLNVDGSLDPGFDAAIAPGTHAGTLKVLADGKLIVHNSNVTKQLNSNGSLDFDFPCSGPFLADDGPNYLMSGCKKWPSGPSIAVARVFPSGAVDGTLDQLPPGGASGWRSAGPNTFYVFGVFTNYLGVNTRRIARVIPETARPKATFDFDGDGKSDLAVFRPSDRTWYLYRSTGGLEYRQWGLANDKIIAGDGNRDGKTDIGVFRDGAWHALTSGSGLHLYACFGAAGDRPVVVNHYRDLDVAGDLFTVRRPSGGSFSWLIGSSGYGDCWRNPSQFTLFSLSGEASGDKTVFGDFNGDSYPEIGYFRNGYWYAADDKLFQAPASTQWGAAGDIPVAGDYDGDRQTDYAIFRPSTGDWWLNRTTDGVLAVRFGQNGDIPVPADYDGDGKMDIAIYRDGSWWQVHSSTSSIRVDQWGLAGDIPIPAQAQF